MQGVHNSHFIISMIPTNEAKYQQLGMDFHIKIKKTIKQTEETIQIRKNNKSMYINIYYSIMLLKFINIQRTYIARSHS